MMPAAYERFRDEFVALAPDRYPPDFVDAQVWAGHWRCTGNDRAAILYELKRYPSGVLEIEGWGAAGDLAEIINLIGEAEAWGRAHGARAAEIDSRPGWVRALAPYGYELTQVRLRKAL